MPVEAKILKINEYLEENEEFYNQISAEDIDQAWLVEVEANLEKVKLMTQEEYF